MNIPSELPVLPLRNAVLFPGGLLPLSVGRPKPIRLVDEAVDGHVLVVAQRDVMSEDASPSELYGVGTVAAVEAP
jgi:ATP-dependent Lon protease